MDYCIRIPRNRSNFDLSALSLLLRMCLKSWNSNYEELLENTHIPTLSSRRTRASMCYLFKIINKQTHFPDAPIASRKIPYNSRKINQNTIMIPKLTQLLRTSPPIFRDHWLCGTFCQKLYRTEYLQTNHF